MKTLKQLTFAIVALCLSFIGVSCDKEPAGATGNTPTIGILEPVFDANSMTVKVMIAPSTDATAPAMEATTRQRTFWSCRFLARLPTTAPIASKRVVPFLWKAT